MKELALQAILEDCPKKYEQALSQGLREGPFGLFLADLAKYLFCEEILKKYSKPKAFPEILIEDQLFQCETKEEFEKLLGIKYTEIPIFENFQVLSNVLTEFQKLNIESYPFKEMVVEELLERDTNHLLQIRWIDQEIGFGVFAKQDIPEKLLIGEYSGLVSSVLFKKDPYFLRLFRFEKKDLFITSKNYGCFSRFINHSYQPNLVAEYAFHKKMIRCFFWTTKEIQKGSQLTINYGSSYWNNIEKRVRSL